jgi:hypothetical protein
MAELVLRLRVDPVTGKRSIAIDYASDSDALPIEHEEEHRKLAEKVLDGGLRNEDITVSREQEAPVTGGKVEAPPVAQPIPQKG